MAKQLDEWIDGDEDEAVAPKGKQQRRPDLAEDLDADENEEWRRERGSRGRKPADKKHRRPKPELDDEF